MRLGVLGESSNPGYGLMRAQPISEAAIVDAAVVAVLWLRDRVPQIALRGVSLGQRRGGAAGRRGAASALCWSAVHLDRRPAAHLLPLAAAEAPGARRVR